MNHLNTDEYFRERLDDQINWYDKKSTSNQNKYKILKVIDIVVAAAIPVIGYFTTSELMFKKFAGVMSAVIIIISGIQMLFRFQENWVKYRTTSESLKREKYLFLTRSKPYNIEEPFHILVANVENLLSKENTNWSKYINGASANEKAPG